MRPHSCVSANYLQLRNPMGGSASKTNPYDGVKPFDDRGGRDRYAHLLPNALLEAANVVGHIVGARARTSERLAP